MYTALEISYTRVRILFDVFMICLLFIDNGSCHWNSLFFATWRYAYTAYAVVRCLSVWLFDPSATFVYCIEFSNFFTAPGRFTILMFQYRQLWQYSDGDPSNGGVACRWLWKKIAIFDEYLALSRKRHKIESYNGRLIGSHIWSIEMRHFQWPWRT